jgi:hypothetical protein
MPHVSKVRLVAQPSGEFFAPSCGDLINDASGTALGGSAARSQQPPLLQPFQAGIDLAQFGRPEMSDPVVQDGLQIVSAGGLTEETKQNVFETHASHYRTYYINVNCFLGRALQPLRSGDHAPPKRVAARPMLTPDARPTLFLPLSHVCSVG